MKLFKTAQLFKHFVKVNPSFISNSMALIPHNFILLFHIVAVSSYSRQRLDEEN